MTIANNIISEALKISGIVGVRQTPLAEDTNTAFLLLNQMIGTWNVQRAQQANPAALVTFANLTTDVSFWTPYEGVLLPNLARTLRVAYQLPPDQELDQSAGAALQLFQSINAQQIAPEHAGPPTTCLQVIWLALRMAGRINDQQLATDSSKDVDDAFSLLVTMIAQWQRRRWIVWDEQEVYLTSTGAMSYTIGPGGDFSLAAGRPDRLENAFVRMVPLGGGSGLNIDIPLAIIDAKEDYNGITLKQLSTLPAAVWYDSAYPLGVLHFWPVPTASIYELHVNVKTPLPTLTSTASTLSGFPPEHIYALIANLACRIVVLSGGVPSPALLGEARAALNLLRMANTQIAELAIPAMVQNKRPMVYAGLGQIWTLGQSVLD